MIRAVIFDMDGLLLDTEKYYLKNWQLAARQCGYPLTREHALHIRSLAQKYAQPYLKAALGEDFDYHKVREIRRELVARDIAENGLESKRGARELLDYLRGKGIKTAVATATGADIARAHLEKVGLYAAFDRVLSAYMVENGKPAPDVYLSACAALGEKPCDCMALEDSPNGIKSAHAAGCRVVMVPDQSPPDEEVRPLLWGVAKDLNEVITLLKKAGV